MIHQDGQPLPQFKCSLSEMNATFFPFRVIAHLGQIAKIFHSIKASSMVGHNAFRAYRLMMFFILAGQASFASEQGAEAQARQLNENLRQTQWKITGRQLEKISLEEVKGYLVSLKAGKRYCFSLGGCEDAWDLDLLMEEQNTKNAILMKDVGVSKNARFEYKPEADVNCRLVVRMRSGTPEGAHFCLLVGEWISR